MEEKPESCESCKHRMVLHFRPSTWCDLLFPPWAESALGVRGVDRQIRDDDWCSFYTRRADNE